MSGPASPQLVAVGAVHVMALHALPSGLRSTVYERPVTSPASVQFTVTLVLPTFVYDAMTGWSGSVRWVVVPDVALPCEFVATIRKS